MPKRAFVPMVTGMVTAYQFPSGVDSTNEPAKVANGAATDKKSPRLNHQPDARAIRATVPLSCQSLWADACAAVGDSAISSAASTWSGRPIAAT